MRPQCDRSVLSVCGGAVLLSWVRRLLLVSTAVVCAATGNAASAATDTDTMTVTATVIPSCDVTANDLAFGNYNPVAASPLDAATTVDVTCTNGTNYVVSLNAGV